MKTSIEEIINRLSLKARLLVLRAKANKIAGLKKDEQPSNN